MSRYNAENRNSLLSLLQNYIDVQSSIQREQNNAIVNYINAQREMNYSLNNLLLRYLEIERITTNFPPPPIPPSPPLFSFNSNNNRAPSQSPINNNTINNRPFSFSRPSSSIITNTVTNTATNTSNTNTRNTQPSIRSNSSFLPRSENLRTGFRNRRRTRSVRPRITTTTNITRTTIPRDVFHNFINNTLSMGNIPQPLNASDISANITNLTYGEIAETTNQTICPFTQENFINSDEISRINPCGHIFTRVHLNRYLTNFDYRCPVCRRNLRRENDVENPPTEPVNNLLDLSSNINILPITENSQETRNIINNAVESVTNALMNNISTQITEDPSRNSFIAEYSFFVPTNLTENLTENLTPTLTSSADSDMQDYLGIPPRNISTQTTLPPLPEDSEIDIPEIDDDEL